LGGTLHAIGNLNATDLQEQPELAAQRRPGRTLLTLIFPWGAYVIAEGVFALWAGFSSKGGEITPRWSFGLIGITGILTFAPVLVEDLNAVFGRDDTHLIVSLRSGEWGKLRQ
jgi:hypothetical protein